MNFQKWLKESLEAFEDKEMTIGSWLLLSLEWVNKNALKNSNWPGIVSAIEDIYSRDLWDWLSDIEMNW